MTSDAHRPRGHHERMGSTRPEDDDRRVESPTDEDRTRALSNLPRFERLLAGATLLAAAADRVAAEGLASDGLDGLLRALFPDAAVATQLSPVLGVHPATMHDVLQGDVSLSSLRPEIVVCVGRHLRLDREQFLGLVQHDLKRPPVDPVGEGATAGTVEAAVAAVAAAWVDFTGEARGSGDQ